MGLQLKLIASGTGLGLSADGTQITVQDQTGYYDSVTNPGGYGTPNPDVSANILLRWKLLLSSAWLLVSGSYAQSDIAAGYAITAINTGLATVAALLPDGVEQIQYLSGYILSGGTVNVVPGSVSVDMASTDITTLVVGMYLSFQSDVNTLYLVIGISGTTVTLDCPYRGTNNTETALQWYSTITNVLVQTYGQNLLNDRLTRYNSEEITDEELKRLMSDTMDNISAQAKMDSGDLQGANDLAISVQMRFLKEVRTW